MAEQLQDASNGVAAGIAEGSYSRGRNRHALYHRALGSANESSSWLDIALACGFFESVDPISAVFASDGSWRLASSK
jgi:four helix bundle protein